MQFKALKLLRPWFKRGEIWSGPAVFWDFVPDMWRIISENAASPRLVSTLWTLRSYRALISSTPPDFLDCHRFIPLWHWTKKTHFRPLTSGFHWCDKLRTHFNHFIAQTFNGSGYFLHSVAGSNDSASRRRSLSAPAPSGCGENTHPPCRHTHFLPRSIHLCSSYVLKSNIVCGLPVSNRIGTAHVQLSTEMGDDRDVSLFSHFHHLLIKTPFKTNKQRERRPLSPGNGKLLWARLRVWKILTSKH